MTPTSVWEALAAAGALGIQLRLDGNRIQARLPDGDKTRLSETLDCLRANREQLVAVLRERREVPPMPAGLKLVSWNPKDPPILIESCSVVVEVPLFIRSTLTQLSVAMSNRNRWIGWTVEQLMNRLNQAGVVVELNQPHAGTRS
jgi:hypothetical protein